MQTILAKTILTKNKYPDAWFGNDYNMNLYRGCHHGCIYCDSRSDCYQNYDFDNVKLKENVIEILSKELRSKRFKGVVGIGAMSDSYNRFEESQQITRQALTLIRDYHFGVSLETKSDLVVRDIDLFLDIQKCNDVIIKMSITCADDYLSSLIEPNVSVSSKRFAAIKKISDAGIFTGVLLHPLLPFITDNDENIKEIVRLSYEAGAKFVNCFFGVSLRDGQREYFYSQLDKKFPDLKEKYIKRYGQKYLCKSKNISHLRYIFEKECKKYGLLYKMEDIINAYKTHCISYEQISLF
ncbi:MAG: radical SAM protein [Coprobacillus sp.]